MLNTELIRENFPILEKIIYLDSASTSLTAMSVVESMNDYYLNYNSNAGRGAYKNAIKTTSKLEKTREKLAKFINSEDDEIIFTKNTTEGINLIANGFDFKKGDNILISNIEHHSNFIPWLNLKKKGISVKIVDVDENGLIEPASLENLLDENTRLVSIPHISNAIGTLQNIQKIEKLVHKNQYKNEDSTYLLLDGAQSLGHIPIDIKKLNPDFMAFPGHKGLTGPKGTGFIYIRENLQNRIYPQNLGGGTIINTDSSDFKLEKAPYRFEGGTQNLPGIIGLGTAVDYIDSIGIRNIEKHNAKLIKKLYNRLKEIDGVEVYGNENNVSIVSFNLDGANPHDVCKILDESENICLRSGHHCAIPIMKHMNTKEGTIRASTHFYNDYDDIEKLINSIEEIAKFYE